MRGELKGYSMARSEECRLCKNVKPLQESHIIPKFIFDWMKRTGPGYLRSAGTPNIRRQDGIRERLFCADCEQILSREERVFAERIFTPLTSRPASSIPYESFLMRFLVSVMFRVIVSKMYGGRPSTDYDRQLNEARGEWRKYLLGKGDLLRYDRIHLIVTDILADRVQPVIGLNQYLARSVDATLAMSTTGCAVYAKFARFMVWAEITAFDQNMWHNTRIVNGSGVLVLPQEVRDGRFGNFLIDRAKGGWELYRRGISERQQGQVDKRFRQEASALQGTDFWRTLEADMESRVDPHTWKGAHIGRNELCPCGSGKKYKLCHGR